MDQLPCEIVVNIADYLTQGCVVVCKCVSREWKAAFEWCTIEAPLKIIITSVATRRTINMWCLYDDVTIKEKLDPEDERIIKWAVEYFRAENYVCELGTKLGGPYLSHLIAMGYIPTFRCRILATKRNDSAAILHIDNYYAEVKTKSQIKAARKGNLCLIDDWDNLNERVLEAAIKFSNVDDIYTIVHMIGGHKGPLFIKMLSISYDVNMAIFDQLFSKLCKKDCSVFCSQLSLDILKAKFGLCNHSKLLKELHERCDNGEKISWVITHWSAELGKLLLVANKCNLLHMVLECWKDCDLLPEAILVLWNHYSINNSTITISMPYFPEEKLDMDDIPSCVRNWIRNQKMKIGACI